MISTIRKPTLIDVGKLLFVGALWGGAFIFIALALDDFGPVSIASWRVSLGAAVMVVITMLIGESFPRMQRDWRNIFIVG